MLQLVHNTWIKGYLEQSLYSAVMLELGKEYRADTVERPWDMVLEMSELPGRIVSKDAGMLDILDRMSGSLLVLGEPGAGKTFTLLELARDAITRAQADPTQPIPVILNLSFWTGKKRGKRENKEEQGKKENAETRGAFKKILGEIDAFLKTKGGRAAGKEKEDGRERHSRHLAPKAKTVKTEARPRSRKTLSGRKAEEKDNQDFKKEEKP